MKKIWNHKITVGDYTKLCGIIMILMVPYYVWVASLHGINLTEGIRDSFNAAKARFKAKFMYRGKREAH